MIHEAVNQIHLHEEVTLNKNYFFEPVSDCQCLWKLDFEIVITLIHRDNF